jgi:hypothetical protein
MGMDVDMDMELGWEEKGFNRYSTFSGYFFIFTLNCRIIISFVRFIEHLKEKISPVALVGRHVGM